MEIKKDFSLKLLNSFRVEASACYFAAFSSVEELEELINFQPKSERMILGGGSNVLFTKDYSGVVLKNEIPGIDIIKEDDRHVYVRVGAGENWHRFVLYCLDRDLAGVENLSLIPGNVGASPMQNIGAYGVELKDVFHDLEAFHLKEKKLATFTNADCRFGYRNSVFKNKYKGVFAITHVTFRLDKEPSLNISYGAIEKELDKMKAEPGIQSVAKAVIKIRSSKLPDPAKIGNAGSFFKNPVVSAVRYKSLKTLYSDIPGYPQEDGSIKIAAGWMIEQCGWKGYRKGDAGCHAQQALVLVNYANASGKEIYQLSEEIYKSVKEKFDISMEREVNII